MKNISTEAKLQNIKVLCKEKNMSLTDLAKAAGITYQGLNKAIKENKTSIDTIIKICKALNVPVHYLFYDLDKVRELDIEIVQKYYKLREEHEACKGKVSELEKMVIELQHKVIQYSEEISKLRSK